MALFVLVLCLAFASYFYSAFLLEDISLSSLVEKKRNSDVIMTVPFESYFLRDDVMEHRTCQKTIIVQRKNNRQRLNWSDQPYDEWNVSDITEFPSLPIDNILCIQIGIRVGALVLSNPKHIVADSFLLGSNSTEHVLRQLQNTMSGATNDLIFKVVERKSIATHGHYELTSPEVRAKRRKNDNSGNFIWHFGATRMINPYTTQFISSSSEDPVSALVMQSANAFYMDTENEQDFNSLKSYIGSLTSLVQKINKPTILLGIGVQMEFSATSNVTSVKLHEHQVSFLNEIDQRNTGKSVSVRGEVTHTASVNAGAKNTISLGCPSLTISRSLDLGQDLEIKWNNVMSLLEKGKHTLKIGVALPAMRIESEDYSQVLDMLLSVCQSHDCYYISQMEYDEKQLLEYTRDKIKIKQSNLRFFREGVESWFEFMHGLDFVLSTRIHGGMAGISNGIPTVIVPTDYRILELVNAMKLPHIPYDVVMNKKLTSLDEIFAETEKDFAGFEINRRHHLKEYRRMLESAEIGRAHV